MEKNELLAQQSEKEQPCEYCTTAHEHADNIRRLKSAEGHLRGIQRMLEDDSYCILVIRQIQAVQAALNKVSANILEQHLNTCLVTAINGEDPVERQRVLKELMDIFSTTTKG